MKIANLEEAISDVDVEERDFVGGSSDISDRSAFDQLSMASYQVHPQSLLLTPREDLSVRSSGNLLQSELGEYNKKIKQHKLLAKLRKKPNK